MVSVGLQIWPFCKNFTRRRTHHHNSSRLPLAPPPPFRGRDKTGQTIGAAGTPRIGFRITELIATIERFLGWDNQTKAVLIGVGSLGTALLGYQGFQNFGFRFVGAFDRDPKVVGKWVHGRKVQAVEQLIPFVRRSEIRLGVLTVPVAVAQESAELMARAGIKGIWNFTPAKLRLPENVVTQKEDLAEGLAVLSHRLHGLHGNSTV